MIYLSRGDIRSLGIKWLETIDVIEKCIRTCESGEYVQPVKPYLRYGDRKNRIIAMPAYVGRPFNSAGLKWIASFPDNVMAGKARASSVVVLNDAATGEVTAIINGSNLSEIRTASVSGVVLREYDRARRRQQYQVGVIGLGPIGRTHIDMCKAILGRAARFVVFDRDEGAIARAALGDDIAVASSWQEAYLSSDVVITCTVSDARYINVPPKAGALLLNVSLRDYVNDMYKHVSKSIFVDDWDEVCRENTDVEQFHLAFNLGKHDTRTLGDIVVRGALRDCPADAAIMFNPMGMAVFDVAMATYYVRLADLSSVGKRLAD